MIEQAFERGSQVFAFWIVNGEVVQARCAGGRRGAVLALPRVKANMVMVATGREEGGGAEIEKQVKAQIVAIEADSPLQIGDLEVNVSDARLRWNGCVSHGFL